MQVKMGFYSRDSGAEDESDLINDLVSDGTLTLAKTPVYYQSASRVWNLYFLNRDLDLGPVDYFKWISNVRAASENAKPEDTIPAEDLNITAFPIAEGVDGAIKSLPNLKPKNPLIPAAIILGLILLLRR